MIISRLQGGLGNQMFQYAYGLYLARRYATELALDTTTLERDPLRTYMLDRMSIQARLMTAAERRLLPRRYGGKGLLNLFRGRMPLRRVHERPFGFHSRYLSPGGHVYLDGYWQSEQFFPQLRELLQAHFQPVSPLRSPSVEIALQMQRLQSVSLHVRRTDYVNNPIVVKIHGACAPTYYQTCVEALLGQFEDLHLYVFSDDHPWCRQNLRFSCPMTHLEYCGPAAAYEDMWLMTRCRHHIVANSSFSWWGAWLGADQSGVVYAPQQWFQDATKDSRWIIPATWKKVASPEVSHLRAA